MPLPITTAVSVPLVCWTICWAAANVSKLILFQVASRCSVIRRIFIFRPFLRDAKRKQIPRYARDDKRKQNPKVKDARPKSKSRRPLQSQKQSQRRTGKIAYATQIKGRALRGAVFRPAWLRFLWAGR